MVNQAEYLMHILVAASQEYVKTYSTRKPPFLTPAFDLCRPFPRVSSSCEREHDPELRPKSEVDALGVITISRGCLF